MRRCATYPFSLHHTKLRHTALILFAGVLLCDTAHAFTERPMNNRAQKIRSYAMEIRQADHETQIARLHHRRLPEARSFHAERAPDSRWLSHSGITTETQEIFDLIADAGEHGLSPDRYELSALEEEIELAGENPSKRKAIDEKITRTIARYAQDLHYGVTDTKRHDRIGTTQPRPSLEATQRDVLAQNNVQDWLLGLAPKSASYAKLQQALNHYRRLQQEGGWPHFQTGRTIKPGDRDLRLGTLIELLTATGDLTTTLLRPAIYDGELVAAVQRFQKRHGLTPDGAIGPVTQAELATPVEDRISQIRLTMERIRQLPDHLGEKFVLINIPAFELTAYNQGEQELRMNVIVGRKGRHTPLFSNRITQAIFNPTWSVPYKIASRDLVKHAIEDPNYFTRGNFTITMDGERVDPTSVDWASIDSSNFPYQIRQAAGDQNALGKVKFPIPDNQSIYLHDTSQPSLFSEDYRALSSGCIRLADPTAFTGFVLEGEKGWDAERIEASLKSTAHKTVNVTPIPVHTVYWTAWVEADGAIQFREDVYKKDGQLLAALGPLDDTAIKLASR